jgi:signal transduction histidine kinase
MPNTWRLLFLLALFPYGVDGQSLYPEQGRPNYVQSFSARDYDAHDQNWDLTQDPRGVMYVANREGVLEYDGRSWRKISVPGQITRSVVTDQRGDIYVGGFGEIGFLAPDSTGTVSYRSLVPHLPEEARDFADVWTTLTTEEGVYFQSFSRIIRWNGTETQVWRAETRFHKAFVVNGRYYARQDGVGLMTVDGEGLHLVAGGDRFAEERIDAMLPLGEDALVVTRNEGLMVLRDGRYVPFRTEADAYLQGERVYHATALSDSTYAFTTISGTVVLMDRAGRVLRVLSEDVGLDSDDLVLYAYYDRQGGLWLALDTGLLRVDVPTPLTTFGQGLGLAGTVYSVRRFETGLYAATSQGLFRLRPADAGGGLLDRHARFVPVGGLRQQVWSVLGVRGRILAAANDGVHEVDGDQSSLVLPGQSFALMQSNENPDLVYVGSKSGLALLRFRNGEWEAAGHVEGLEAVEVRYLTEAHDGSLWMGGAFDGILRVWIDGERLVRTEQYGVEEGLPASPVSVNRESGQLVAQAPTGVFRLDAAGERRQFVPDSALSALVGLSAERGERNYLINTSQEGRIWVVKGGRVHVYTETEEGYEEATPPILHLEGVGYQFLYVEDDGTAWIDGADGLLRYNPSVEKDYATSYPTLVRRVTTGRDSLLFGGAMSVGFEPPELAYGRNNLRFTFSAPTFNAPEKTEYQYWLEGFDEGWSKWTPETTKEYTNLPERTYRFQVRARNAQGEVSRVGIYAFEVLPPWYRTWWAYSLYVLAFAAIVWGYGDFRIRQHRRMLAHEQAVNQRLDTANARLREANERLHHADKLKDDFLANTSHELRTPLTAILGFASVLQEDLSGELRHFAQLIQRGGERLLDTVNAMLDMARLQADMVDVQLSDLDVVDAAREVVRGLEPLAREKGIFVRVMPESRAIEARMDRFCLERILLNLIGNAVKFTEEGGVTVLVDATDDQVHLVVRDTGIGIEQKALPELFSEFQQASTGYGRTHEGNGLGLAITQRIVHMLGGEISVEGNRGGGSVFRVTLPRYDEREHLQSAEPEDARLLLDPSTRLLLVEDPARPQFRLRQLVASQCHLDVAVGAEEGLAAVQRDEYDGLLVDGHVEPLPCGQPFLDALRVLPGRDAVPAIAVTGFKMPGDHERFVSAGYAGHIGKPYTGRRLYLLLESVFSAGEPVPEGG